MNSPSHQQAFKAYNCCVLIPTFNNERTLKWLLDGVLEYTNNVIVVNDGSTDSTSEILENCPQITLFNHPKNTGKGTALRTGFKEALHLGYKHAITIDSDGQHYPNDIPVFLEELRKSHEADKDVLVVGLRQMEGDTVPNKSKFGHKFANFWFWVETGIKLDDTQCGYRLYPLEPISKMKLSTNKFELETEVIVKAAWRGVDVYNEPVKVLYDPKTRVSHFRPVIDFTRITILNIWYVIITFLLIGPRNMFKKFNQKGIKRFWKEDVLKSQEPPLKKASAVALGVFIGISPFWGLHTAMVFFLSALFRLNKVTTFLFSNVSFPPFIPFVLYASYQTGLITLGKGPDWKLNMDTFTSASDLGNSLGTYILGSMILAIVAGFLVGFLFYILFSIRQPNTQPNT